MYNHFNEKVVQAGSQKEQEWNESFKNYKEAYPELANQLEVAIKGELPAGWDQDIPVYEEGKTLASRASSGEVLNAIAQKLPYFIGGSADLAGSNNTTIKGELILCLVIIVVVIFGLEFVNLRWVLP